MSRLIAERAKRQRAMFGSLLPLSEKLGYRPNELELFAFERYKLSNAARDIAIIASRRNPISAMRCYMAIFFSV